MRGGTGSRERGSGVGASVGVAEVWGGGVLVGGVVGLGKGVLVALGLGLRLGFGSGAAFGVGAQPAEKSRTVSKQARSVRAVLFIGSGQSGGVPYSRCAAVR